MNNRIKEIIQMIQNESGDPFLLYVLALEYGKLDEKDEAGKNYRRLLIQFPEYLPAYYQAGHFFWQTGSVTEAKTTFLKGIELAIKIHDKKTEQELKNAYQNFLIDVDEG
jgi:tetratricopeptide (TPR) repeat protein